MKNVLVFLSVVALVAAIVTLNERRSRVLVKTVKTTAYTSELYKKTDGTYACFYYLNSNGHKIGASYWEEGGNVVSVIYPEMKKVPELKKLLEEKNGEAGR